MNKALFLIHTICILILLLFSYAVRFKGENKWKGYLLLPLFILLIAGLYVCTFRFDLSSLVSWVQLQVDLLINGISVSHTIVLVFLFLALYLVFILFKIIYKSIISLGVNIPVPFYGKRNENGAFHMYPEYFYYSFFFKYLTIFTLLFLLIYSYLQIDTLLFISDMFLILCFELMLVFSRKKSIPQHPTFCFEPENEIDKEPLKNIQNFEKFYNELKNDSDLQHDIQLSIQRKIRVIKEDLKRDNEAGNH